MVYRLRGWLQSGPISRPAVVIACAPDVPHPSKNYWGLDSRGASTLILTVPPAHPVSPYSCFFFSITPLKIQGDGVFAVAEL